MKEHVIGLVLMTSIAGGIAYATYEPVDRDTRPVYVEQHIGEMNFAYSRMGKWITDCEGRENRRCEILADSMCTLPNQYISRQIEAGVCEGWREEDDH